MGLFKKKPKDSENSAYPPKPTYPPNSSDPHYSCHRESYLACKDCQTDIKQRSQPYDPSSSGGFRRVF